MCRNRITKDIKKLLDIGKLGAAVSMSCFNGCLLELLFLSVILLSLLAVPDYLKSELRCDG